jgi:hypothetical protein
MKKLSWLLIAGMSLAAFAAPAQPQQLKIKTICEERHRDEDIAVVAPARQELFVRAGPNGPWGFAFAGIETKCGEKLELEVEGSGGYEHHDIFSIAGLAIDYGGENGWIERSIFGLGLIQDSRQAHPPGWGAGVSGKSIMRGQLVSAKPQAAKVTLDLKKYAPASWDGRVWIGAMLHNTGPSRWVSVRIVGGPEAAAAKELDDDSRAKLRREHEKKFLEQALAELGKHPVAKPTPTIIEALRPYAAARLAEESAQPIGWRVCRARGIALRVCARPARATRCYRGHQRVFQAMGICRLVWEGHRLHRSQRDESR